MIPAHWQSKINYFRFLLRQQFNRKIIKTPPIFTISSGEFDNSGLCIIHGKADHLTQKTIIVIGDERGGTSMIAGTLVRLGIYMGDTLSSAVQEDHKINHCLRLKDKKGLIAIIKERNQLHAVWGLKKPTLTLLKSNWKNLFREPVYIVIFRDVFAIANRRSVSRGLDLFSGMYASLNHYQTIINFVQQTKRPTLLISYEKVLLNPEQFVRNLADFLGINDQEQLDNAIAFIEPSPQAYHSMTMEHKGWRGMLENVSTTQVSGWGYREGDKTAANVVLTLADGTEIVTPANLSRPDVQEYHKHVSEFSGFQFQLAESQYLKNGEMVSVRIEGEKYDIGNSPFVYHL